MAESSTVSYNYEFAARGREIIKWNIPPPKGAVVIVKIHLVEVSKTKLRNADGQVISCCVEEITSPPLYARIVMSTQILAVPSYRDQYIENLLADQGMDQSTSDYLARRIISHALGLTAHTNGRDNDTKSYEIAAGLIVTRVEVTDEEHLFGGFKEEVFEVGDGELSCGVCLEEVSGGSRCIRITCSHVFHMFCIIRWLLQNKKCPICRRVLLWSQGLNLEGSSIIKSPAFYYSFSHQKVHDKSLDNYVFVNRTKNFLVTNKEGT